MNELQMSVVFKCIIFHNREKNHNHYTFLCMCMSACAIFIMFPLSLSWTQGHDLLLMVCRMKLQLQACAEICKYSKLTQNLSRHTFMRVANCGMAENMFIEWKINGIITVTKMNVYVVIYGYIAMKLYSRLSETCSCFWCSSVIFEGKILHFSFFESFT